MKRKEEWRTVLRAEWQAPKSGDQRRHVRGHGRGGLEEGGRDGTDSKNPIVSETENNRQGGLLIWESIDERVFSPTYRIQSLKFYSMNQIDYIHCVAIKTMIIIHNPNNKNTVRYIHSVPCLKHSQGFRQRLTAVFWTKHLLIIKNMHKKLKFNGFSLFPHT